MKAWVCRLFASSSVVAAMLGSAAAQVGDEFIVKTGSARYPSVAADADGDFVVVWEVGFSSGVSGQRFDSAGTPQGDEFSLSGGGEFSAAVAMNDAGAFVVAYSVTDSYSNTEVFVGRFDSTGGLLASEFQVNDYSPSNQYRASVAIDDEGDFAVVWQSNGQDGQSGGIFGRRYDSSGATLGGEFQVNTYTSDGQYKPSVAMDADGDFVVAWESGHDGAPDGIFGQRFDSAGARQGGEFLVNAMTVSVQSLPAVAMDETGNFVVAFRSAAPGGGIMARRFDSSGAAVGTEARVNTFSSLATPSSPAVDLGGSGDFVVVWFQSGQDDGGGQGGSFGQRLDSSGAKVGGEFQVNVYTDGQQYGADVAMDANGDFVVVWKDFAQYGIFGRRFFQSAGPVLDVDGSGSLTALTDGLLILRYLFGLTGAPLIASAVDLDDCTRCDADAILAYLVSIDAQLDIDLDGETAPLTDGLLILRWLFNLSGSVLIAGVVDLVNCGRCLADAIAAYIAGLAA